MTYGTTLIYMYTWIISRFMLNLKRSISEMKVTKRKHYASSIITVIEWIYLLPSSFEWLQWNFADNKRDFTLKLFIRVSSKSTWSRSITGWLSRNSPLQHVVFSERIFYLAQKKISSLGSFTNDTFGKGTAKITLFYHVRVCSLMSVASCVCTLYQSYKRFSTNKT